MSFKVKFFSILSLFFLLTACSSEKEVLKVAISPWPGYEPLVLGVEKKFYKNIDVRIVRYATPSESFRALRDGIVDVACFTADEVLHYAEVRDKPKIFLVLDISNGGDAIVARPDIKSISDLKGKKVYVESSALGNYVIKRSLDFADNITINDIELSTVELAKHIEDYVAGKVDAVVTYEPFLTQLLDAGAHILFDSSQIPQEIVDVMVTNNETLLNKQDAIKELVNGWYKTQEYIKSNEKVSMQKMAGYENVSEKEFLQSYKKLTVPSKEETIEMLDTKNKTFQTALERLAELMYDKGSITKKIDPTLLVEPKLVMQK